jgi:hypothetical protein
MSHFNREDVNASPIQLPIHRSSSDIGRIETHLSLRLSSWSRLCLELLREPDMSVDPGANQSAEANVAPEEANIVSILSSSTTYSRSLNVRSPGREVQHSRWS